MTGLMVVEGEALEGAPQSALAESLNSIADHAIMLNVGTTTTTHHPVQPCFKEHVSIESLLAIFAIEVAFSAPHVCSRLLGSAEHCTPMPPRVSSLVFHVVLARQAGLARKKVFPAVDVTYQMNLQNPGSALLPEPMKAFVQVSNHGPIDPVGPRLVNVLAGCRPACGFPPELEDRAGRADRRRSGGRDCRYAKENLPHER